MHPGKVLLLMFLIPVSLGAAGQTIIGKWQLVKESNCIEKELASADDEPMVNEMRDAAKPGPQVIQFKANSVGEESTRLLSSKKVYNPKSFMYKFTGEALYILDKKSRTIVEGFFVEKLSADSLVLSNASRACDMKFFIKAK